MGKATDNAIKVAIEIRTSGRILEISISKNGYFSDEASGINTVKNRAIRAPAIANEFAKAYLPLNILIFTRMGHSDMRLIEDSVYL